MPVTAPVNSVASVRLEYRSDSDVAYNVLHYRLKSATVISTGLPLAFDPVASDILPALAHSRFDALSVVWAPCASADVVMTGATAQKIFPGDRSTPYTWPAPADVPGTVASERLPLQDSPTLVKRTGFGQRWGIGRVFYVGIAEDDQETGFVTDDWATRIVDFGNIIKGTATVTVGGVIYVWEPVVAGGLNTATPHINTVVDCALSSRVIKSQKRRRPGKGI